MAASDTGSLQVAPRRVGKAGKEKHPVLFVQVDPALSRELHILAAMQDRSKSSLVRQVLRAYVAKQARP